MALSHNPEPAQKIFKLFKLFLFFNIINICSQPEAYTERSAKKLRQRYFDPQKVNLSCFPELHLMKWSAFIFGIHRHLGLIQVNVILIIIRDEKSRAEMGSPEEFRRSW